MFSTGYDGELARNESVGHYKGAPGQCRQAVQYVEQGADNQHCHCRLETGFR